MEKYHRCGMPVYPETTIALENEPPKQTRRFGMLPALRALRQQLEGLTAEEVGKLPSANPKPKTLGWKKTD